MGDLKNKSMVQLREMANEVVESGIEKPKGMWKFTKEQLIDFINENYKFPTEIEEIPTDEIIAEALDLERGQIFYEAISPTGTSKAFIKKEDLYDFAVKNKICNKGWVDRSIKEKSPVRIGGSRPRKSQKYNGNGWRFVKRVA